MARFVNAVDNSDDMRDSPPMPRRGKGDTTTATTRLDPDKIVVAALAVADRDGLSGTTLRKVGAELGVDPTAVYRHFDSKDDLVAAMAERLFNEVVEGEMPTDWRPRLEYLFWAGREIYRSHAAIVDVLAVHPEDTASLVAINEIGLAALRDAGLDDADAARFHQVLVAYTLGSGIVSSGWDDKQSERDATRRAYAALDPAQFPAGSSMARHLFPPGDEWFALGFGILLDAIEARAATTTSKRTRRITPR